MATLLQRWWTSLGHGVHSPTAFRLITSILDQRGVTYYPKHLNEANKRLLKLHKKEQQLALQLLHQWPLTQLVTQYDPGVLYQKALILWGEASLTEAPWDTQSILWHIGREIPIAFRQRPAGILVDYGEGQLLLLDRKLPSHIYHTRIRH